LKQTSLLIHKNISDHFQRATFYRRWKQVQRYSKDPDYFIYEVLSAASEYKDIIPIILKYSPNILVLEPEELNEKIHNQLKEHITLIENAKV